MIYLIILLVAIFIGIILYDIPKLVKQKMWKELITYSIIMAIGMALGIPQVYKIRPPNPNDAIEAIFRPIGEMLKR